jgi:hypothetical protein
MSYYQKISQDYPMGFWTLENGYITKDVSSGSWQSGQRVKNNLILSDPSPTFYQDTFPLVMGGTNAYKFSSSNSFKINNIYNVFYRNTEKKVFTMEFWISFDDIPQSEQIITIKNDSNIVGYLIFKDNFAAWTMWDRNNNAYTAKALIDSYEPQLYVVMSYLDRSMNITINGVNSAVARIPEGSQFMPLVSDPPYFQFGPRNNTTYAIDNVAFYNYTLTKLQMEQRYAWAKNEKNSDTFTIKNNGGTIDFHDKMGVVNDYILFNTNDTWSTGSTRNLTVENNSIETKFISAATPYNNVDIASISYSTISSKTGLVTTSSNSIAIENFEDIFNISTDAITCQVYFSSSNTSRSCYYSISGFNLGTLVLEATSNSKIRLYSFENPTLIDLSFTPPASGWYDVKVYMLLDKIYFQINQETTLVAQYSSNITSGNLNAYLGNCYADNSINYPTDEPVANFGIFDKVKVASDSLLDIQQGATTLFSLNATLAASQYAVWNTLINLDSESNIVGSRVYYDTASKNVSVQFSYDNETWYTLEESGDQIPNFPLYTNNSSIYIRVIMNSPDSENVRLFMNYLEITTFRKLFMDSEGFPFSLTPVQNSNNTMIIKNNKNNILARDANVGIYFQPESSVGHKAGSSLITCYENYSTIEFIFRLEDSIGGAYCYLIDSSDSQNYIRYNPSNMQLSWAGFNKVYLNGFAIASGKVIQVGEMYHLAAVKNSAILETVTLTLNSKYDNTLHAHSTYGKLCIYSDAKSDQFIRGKYLRMIGMNKYCISDSFSGSIVDSSSVYDEPDAIIAV